MYRQVSSGKWGLPMEIQNGLVFHGSWRVRRRRLGAYYN